MSRRRRGPRPESIVPAAQAATPVSGASVLPPQNRHERRREEKLPAFVFCRPVVIDTARADIDDWMLVQKIGALGQAGDGQAVQEYLLTHMEDIHGLLNRVVKGGTTGRPAAEFTPLLTEVLKKISNLGN